MINIKMQTREVHRLSPKIKVIGVGGAGGNAVNNMITSSLEGCEFIVCNTDAQALQHSPCEHKIQLGIGVTGGLGAGTKPEIGRAAAEESLEDVMKHIEGANMVFVTAGMGGGTGTGAAPVIARACREMGVLTVGVVTKPFHFEGSHRMRMAEAGLEELQKVVDTLIVIPNQNLFRVANEKTTFAEAFRMADSVLQSGVRGVTDLMVRPGLVNLDFADIRTAMMEMGKAMMGTGEASGDKRAVQAAEAAINNPLLDDVSMKGAHGVIINVTGGYDMTLFEADEACNRIRDEVDPDANIIFGATFDESLEGTMRVSIVATGIEKEAFQKTRGGSGTKTVQAKAGLERAKPNMEMHAQALTAPSPVVPAYSASNSIRGITAPPVMAPPVAAAAAPVLPEIKAAEASELDTYDQHEFAVVADTQVSMPQNTALRGERYRDAFIPPRPAEAAVQEEMEIPAASYGTASGFHAMPTATPRYAQRGQGGSSAGLQLNPPRPSQKKRAPSLFERITGTVQSHLEGMREEAEPHHPRTAPPAGYSSPDVGMPKSPSQGRLNIDAPAAKPRIQVDGEVDIPTFLRRQAN